jgi:hypothetical protein
MECTYPTLSFRVPTPSGVILMEEILAGDAKRIASSDSSGLLVG